MGGARSAVWRRDECTGSRVAINTILRAQLTVLGAIDRSKLYTPGVLILLGGAAPERCKPLAVRTPRCKEVNLHRILDTTPLTTMQSPS